MMFLPPLSSLAADAVPVAPADLMLVIRAKNDQATRDAATRIEAAAEAGNSFAMYDIGSLHRQSSRKGAAVFAYDPGKSLKWLTRAFSAGRLTAAYKIALIYSEIGDDMEAMGWAKLYSQFVRPSERTVGQQQLRLALMDELYRRIGRDREEAIDARKMTLIDRHGRDHEANQKVAAIQHPDWAERGLRCEPAPAAESLASRLQLPGHSLIEFLVKVDAKGKVDDYATFDAAPYAVSERDLRALMKDLACPAGRNRDQYLFHFVQVRSPNTQELTED